MIVDANLLLYAVDDASLFTAPQWNGSAMCSADADFSKFMGVECVNPFA